MSAFNNLSRNHSLTDPSTDEAGNALNANVFWPELQFSRFEGRSSGSDSKPILPRDAMSEDSMRKNDIPPLLHEMSDNFDNHYLHSMIPSGIEHDDFNVNPYGDSNIHGDVPLTDDSYFMSEPYDSQVQPPTSGTKPPTQRVSSSAKTTPSIARSKPSPLSLVSQSEPQEDDDDDNEGGYVPTGDEQSGRWTKEEHELFLQALRKYGKVRRGETI